MHHVFHSHWPCVSVDVTAPFIEGHLKLNEAVQQLNQIFWVWAGFRDLKCRVQTLVWLKKKNNFMLYEMLDGSN